MTFKISPSIKDNDVTPASYSAKLANDSSNTIPVSLSSSSAKLSKSKVIKKHAIHLIRFCLKSGIDENKNIIKFLEENEIFLPDRTFDRYKSIAEKELESDLDADIWLSEKTQNGLVRDYKEISDRYDRQLVLDDVLIQSLIKQAVDKAINFDNDPGKYYRYLDFGELMKIQAISNYTMKNKLELISKGFMVYRIKKHIDDLRNQIHENKSKIESKEIDLSSLSFLAKSNVPPQVSCNKSGEPQIGEYDQKYLDESDSVIGMNGRPIKKYLAEIERKLGKPLSTI